jgi:hypothetical protein
MELQDYPADRPRFARRTRAGRKTIAPRSPRVRKRRPDLTLSSVRSALSNGALLHNVDHRGAWVRRFRDLLHAHEADLGGENALSEGQRSIIRRAAMLELQLELLESKFAANDGAATARELETYQRASNSLRRLLESLGLHRGRRARDITPDLREYLESKAAEAETAE